MPQKYLIETFGCQMNVHDSERMAGLLEQAGYEPTDEASDADVVVINTCSVREHAEEKLYTRLGELRVLREETGRDPIVAVAGCVAQQEGEALLRRSREADLVVGTQAFGGCRCWCGRRSRIGGPPIDLRPTEDVSFPLGVTRRQDPVKAWVTIIEGCNECCASASCRTPGARSGCGRRPTSWPRCARRWRAGGGRSSCSDRS